MILLRKAFWSVRTSRACPHITTEERTRNETNLMIHARWGGAQDASYRLELLKWSSCT